MFVFKHCIAVIFLQYSFLTCSLFWAWKWICWQKIYEGILYHHCNKTIKTFSANASIFFGRNVWYGLGALGWWSGSCLQQHWALVLSLRSFADYRWFSSSAHQNQFWSFLWRKVFGMNTVHKNILILSRVGGSKIKCQRQTHKAGPCNLPSEHVDPHHPTIHRWDASK